MNAGRLRQVARPLGRRDHDRERAVGLEAVVEQAERLGDPARVHVVVARQRLVAHRRRRDSRSRACGTRARRWRGGRGCRRTRACSGGSASRSRRPGGGCRTGASTAGCRRGAPRPAPTAGSAASARLRARHATATSHWPVATAIAAWPTTPQPAPPPKPTCEKNVMSPRPTARATSTSRFGSIVNDASPSTSDGAMPASSSASEIAWHASDSSVSGSPLPNVVCPMPTTAVLSLISSAWRRLDRVRLTSPSTPACGARGTTRRLRRSPRSWS